MLRPHALAFPLLAASLAAQWTLETPATSPGNRSGHMMAADANGDVVMFGGAGSFAPNNQTWRYDGSTWTQLTPATSPTARIQASFVHDLVRNRFVLYGGWGSALSVGTASNQTWEFDGLTWTQVNPPTSPPGLWKHGACFDIARNRVVVYGGALNGFPIAESATWEFNGTTWSQVATPTNPGPLERPAMCYSLALGRTVLFGGIDPQTGGTDATWLFDGANWVQVAVAGPKPSARAGARMVYDGARGVCVLTGGQDPVNGASRNDTWEFDGTAWTQVPGALAPGRDFGLAFDAARRLVVRHGGIAGAVTNGDTYRFGARAEAFGAGCLGANGVPALTTNDTPRTGGSWPIALTNANATVPIAVLVLGLANAPGLPLDAIGMPGCTAWVTADLLLAGAATNGVAAWSVPIPPQAAIVGVELFAQGLSLDPTWNAAGLVASNALRGLAGR
jgi:hypothetical protein